MRTRYTILSCWLLMACAVVSSLAEGAAAQSHSPALALHLEAAQRAQANQDCKTAAREYALAVRLMPTSGELYSNEGSALYCDDQMPEAIKAFKKALALQPKLFAPYLFLGLAAYHVANLPTAARHLQQAAALNPSDITVHLWLGYTYVAQSSYDAALKQFRTVTLLDPANVDAEYAMGQCYLEIGRKSARDLAALAPKSRLLLQLASEQYKLTGDSAKAAQLDLEAAQNAAGPSLDSKSGSREQELYHQASDAEEKARQAFQQVMQFAPDSYRAHQIMADASVAMQKNDEAIAEYRSVLQLNPALPGIHESISNCLMQAGKFSQALEELQEEEKLQPFSARVQMETGRIQLAMSDDTQAIASLIKALTLGDPPPETYLLLGKAMLRGNDAARAIPLLQKYIAHEPEAPVAYYLLARAYRMTGNQLDMTRALEAYKRTSQDEHDRRLLQQVTQDPKALPSMMNAQEVQDANALVSTH